jgi:uncharacterized coiled-coil DUF342 family protein
MQQQFDFMGKELVDSATRVFTELLTNRDENARAAREFRDKADEYRAQRDSAITALRRAHALIGELLKGFDDGEEK